MWSAVWSVASFLFLFFLRKLIITLTFVKYLLSDLNFFWLMNLLSVLETFKITFCFLYLGNHHKQSSSKDVFYCFLGEQNCGERIEMSTDIYQF